MPTLEVHLATSAAPRFVGRAEELGWLRELLAEADRGDARLGLVGGEPGVGKTSLVREFLSESDAAGWQTIWGRCSEDADSPHLPFRLGLIPQLRKAGLIDVDGPGPLQGEDAAAVASSLAEMTASLAARRGMVFVIDDLQFAELGTLNLIREYLRDLAEIARREPLRVLVLVTHHLALPGDDFGRVLDRLRSEPFSRARELHGLREIEVHELVRAAASATSCDPRFLGSLLETTAGNPFFILELLRSLERQHLLVNRSGKVTSKARLVDPHLPATAMVSVSQRLGFTSQTILGPLQTAALLGNEFGLDELAAFHPLPEVETAIDSAVKAGWVVERGDHFGFSHGIVRTATLESIGPMRRRGAHTLVAAELIRRHGTSSEHSIQIASHVEAAGRWPDEREAGEIFERAGQYAMSTFAWAIGLKFYEAALACPAFVESLSPLRLGELYAQAARASGNNGDHERGRERHRLAMEHYRAAGDLTGWGLQLLGWWRTFTNFHERLPEDGAYEEFMAAAGAAALEVRVQLAMHRAEALSFARHNDDLVAGEEALGLARQSADRETRAYAEVVMGLIRMRHLDAESAKRHFLAGLEEATTVPNPRVKGWGAARLPMPLILMGELSEARAACLYARNLARGGDDLSNGPLAVAVSHTAAVLSGEFESARALRTEGALYESRSAQPDASFILHSSVAWERMLRGEFEEAQDALAGSGGRGRSRALQLLIAARGGARGRVLGELEGRPMALAASGVDNNNLGAIAAAAELSGEVGDVHIAQRALELLEPVIERGIVFCGSPPALLPRAVAIAARTCGRMESAADFLGLAKERAETANAGPELGLVALEEAKLRSITKRPVEEVAEAVVAAGAIFARLDMVGASAWVMEFAEQAGLTAHTMRLLPAPDELSATEEEILQGLARGADFSTIADSLLISRRTVEAAIGRFHTRLSIANPGDAHAYLLRRAGGSVGGAQPAGAGPLSELTSREREVLALVARGLTNQQIADELVISLHTAIRHVANILGKTGAANRTEAARFEAHL